jgi:hypothetical protein
MLALIFDDERLAQRAVVHPAASILDREDRRRMQKTDPLR